MFDSIQTMSGVYTGLVSFGECCWDVCLRPGMPRAEAGGMPTQSMALRNLAARSL